MSWTEPAPPACGTPGPAALPWLEPQWPVPARVHACMTTRAGGVSRGVFASMNLGDHVGDDPAHVACNRAQLAARLGVRPVFLRQVHGTRVLALGPQTPDGLQADGALSQQPGLACVVMVADCLPILLAHERLPVVAALHAGWRGLAGVAAAPGVLSAPARQGGQVGQGALPQGIVEAGLAAMQAATGVPAADLAPGLLAWLGPCIGPQAFEVGPEVRAAFVAAQPEAAACFVPGRPGKHLADLPALARLRLAAHGVARTYGNDGSVAWCTVGQSGLFSHRRTSGAVGAQPGDTGGRMAACIWLG